jgi:polyhydroxyalkanoate synthesis regulator phasin
VVAPEDDGVHTHEEHTMVREALTGYWSLVGGLTEVTVERARAAARAMLAQGEATRDQVTGLAQEITEASRANRAALLSLIRYEAERAAGRLGFASADEVTTLQGRVRELERSIAELRAAAAATAPAAGAARKAPARKAAEKKPAEKKPAKAAKAAANATTAAKAAPGRQA